MIQKKLKKYENNNWLGVESQSIVRELVLDVSAVSIWQVIENK